MTAKQAYARTLDQQCQKLRQNYSAHRKQKNGSKSRTRSTDPTSQTLDTKTSSNYPKIHTLGLDSKENSHSLKQTSTIAADST